MARRELNVLATADASRMRSAFRTAAASTRPLRTELEKTGRSAQKAERSSDRLARSSRGLGSHLKTAAKAAAGAAVAYVGISEAKKAISVTEELALATISLHKNLGLSVKESSEWAAVAKTRGVETNKLGMAFKTLSTQVTNANRGSKTSVEAFEKLGFSQRDINRGTKDFHFLLSKTAEGLHGMSAGAEKAAVTGKLFGRGWMSIAPVLRDGAKSMQDQLNLANKYGATFGGKSLQSVKDLVKAQREMKFAQLGMQIAFTTKVAPALMKVGLALASFINQMRTGKGVGGAISATFRALGAAIGWTVNAIKAAIPVIVRFSKGIASAFIDTVSWVTRAARNVANFVSSLVPVRIGVAIVARAFNVLKIPLGFAVHTFLSLARNVLPVVGSAVRTVWHVIQRLGSIVGNVVGIVSNLLRGKFGGAWRNAKALVGNVVGGIVGIVRDGFGVIRSVVRGVAGVIGDVFGAAWRTVKGVFEHGVNAVIDFINTLAGAINWIPGVPDIHLKHIGGGGGKKKSDRRYSGGAVTRPTVIVGEEAPTHPEWVIATNPAYRRKNIQYWYAAGHDLGVPGFQLGGLLDSLPMTGTEGVSAAKLIAGLPKPHLPWPFQGLGKWIIHQVSGWITDSLKHEIAGSLKLSPQVKGFPELQPGIRSIVGTVLAQWPGLQVTSTYRPGYTHSYHGAGRAADLAASPEYMIQASAWISKWLTSRLIEGIHNPNLSVKYGHAVPAGFWGEPTWGQHRSHIHLARREGGLIGFARGGRRRRRRRQGIEAAINLTGNLNDKFTEKVRQIWGAAAPFFGQSPSSPPPTYMAELYGLSGQTRFNPDMSRSVYVNQAYARQLIRNRGPLIDALPHEWVHYFQPTSMMWQYGKRKVEIEGGALGFTKKFAPMIYRRLGIPYHFSVPEQYRGYLAQVVKSKGWPWIEHGQFEGYRHGGLIGLARGGRIFQGKVSTFGPPGEGAGTTASGASSSQPGIALLNRSTLGSLFAVEIGGHRANLKQIDIGPASWTGRVIDVTGAGARAMGINPLAFPTDSWGRATLLGGGRGGGAGGGVKERPKTGLGGGSAVSLPPMKRSRLLPSARGLARPYRRMLEAPGMTYAGKMGVAELAVEQAGYTKDTRDDIAALNFQLELLERNRGRLRKEINKVNRELSKKRMTPKQRKRLLERRAKLEESLHGVEGGIGQAKSQIGEAEGGEGGEGEETEAQKQAREAIEAQTKAIEEQKQATEEQKQAQEELSKELKRQTDFAQSAVATTSAQAWGALADILSGQMGPRGVQRSRTAGTGTIGGVGRI